MATQLNASIVRVVRDDGAIAGSGFLVSKRHVLTCAHVVAQALGLPQSAKDVAASVRLTFPFSECTEAKAARVIFWNPVQSDSSNVTDRTEDIAVLEMESELPDDAQPSPVRAVDELWNHSFRTFGFPVGYDDGTWARGEILDAQARGWVQIQGKTETGYPVGPGFSGAPVWDDEISAVVGMVVVADKRAEVKAAFMIPINTLMKAWPSLLTEATDFAVTQKAADRIDELPQRIAGDRIDATRLFKTRDPAQVLVGKALANPSTRVVSVIGHAGIGKTTLASKVLNDLEGGRWPHTEDRRVVDGIVYLSTQRSGGISFPKLFLECGRMLGGRKKVALEADFANANLSSEQKARGLLKALEGGLYVILLDDIEDILDENKRFKDPELQTFFESSLCAADGTRLLVTSRVALSFPVGHSHDDNEVALEEGLSEKDAIAMLRELDPTGKGRLLNAKEEELRDAVNRVHRVPRAIELIANKMIQNRLTKLDSILDRFYRQDEVVSYLFKQGYDQLGGAARKVMEALAVFGCAVAPEAVQYILNESAPEVDALVVLGQLVDTYMASSDGVTVSLHPLDQEYVYDTLPDEGDWSRKKLEYLASEYYKSQRTLRESWQTIDDVQPYLREFEHRVKYEDYDAASAALSAIDVDFMIWRGYAQPALNLRKRLEGKLTDRRQQMRQAFAMGNIREFLGPLPEAIRWFEEARKLAPTVDKEIECHATGQLGEVYRRLGQLDKAIELLQQAVTMAGKFEDEKKHSWHLLCLGLACIYNGDLRAGIAHAKSLIKLAEAAGDKMAEAQAYDCFSLAFLVLGQFLETIAYTDKAISVYNQVDERNSLMYVLNVRGMALLGLGKLDEGIAALDKARQMSEDDHYARLEGFALFNLACAYRMRGETDKALQHASEASKKLSDVEAAEGSAANSLVRALAASKDQRAEEVRALLDCARCSMSAPDIYDANYVAKGAREIAQAEGMIAEIAEAEAIIAEGQARLILPN